MFALGDVLDRAEKLSGTAGVVTDQFPFAIDVPNLSVRTDDSILEWLGTNVGGCFRSTGHRKRLIVRVDHVEDALKRCLECFAANPENTIGLIRPFALSGSQIAQVAAHLCKSLRPLELILALAHPPFGLVTVGNVLDRANQVARSAGLIPKQFVLQIDFPHAAIGLNEPVFEGIGAYSLSNLILHCGHLRVVVRMEQAHKVFR